MSNFRRFTISIPSKLWDKIEAKKKDGYTTYQDVILEAIRNYLEITRKQDVLSVQQDLLVVKQILLNDKISSYQEKFDFIDSYLNKLKQDHDKNHVSIEVVD